MTVAGAGRRLVARQRAAAERLRRELAAADGSSGHTYFRDLRRDMRRPVRDATVAAILDRCTAADIVYVGDYHAVGACQRFAADTLQALIARERRTVLGVEFVHTRQQHILDLRQNGAIDDAAFLRRVHYDDEWGFPWEGYRDLLDRAREGRVPVIALDRPPRGGIDRIGQRDDHAARRIVASIVERPGSRLVVFFGESHLSRGHLPRRVRAIAARSGLAPREVRILQDPDAAYWSIVAELGAVPVAVAFDETTFAVFHTTPLAKYEAYRQVLDRWREDVPGDEEVDLTPAVHHLIGVLRGWIGIGGRTRLRHAGGWAEDLVDVYPEVYGGADSARLLGPILREHGRSDDEVAEAEALVSDRGAIYESRSNTIFIGAYRPGRVAGEAARFLRVALAGRLFEAQELAEADPADRAYGAAYNEALVYLGARLVDPASEVVIRNERRVLARAASGVGGEPDARERLLWLDAHRRFELSGADAPPSAILDPLRRSRSLRRTLARDLGHRLGTVWFEAVASGRMRTRELRRVFAAPLDPPRARQAVVRWLRLARTG